MTQDRIQVTRQGGVALCELSSPATLNAFDPELSAQLLAFLEGIDVRETPVAVITGSGRAFSTGGDVKAMQRGEVRADYMRLLNRVVLRMVCHEAIVVAAVNGLAYGGGLSLMLAADLAVAAADARFAMAHVGVGLVPDMGAHFFLPLLVGMPRAKALMWSGEPFGAEEALHLGLVNAVVPAEELRAQSLAYAQRLASGPRQALRHSKRMVNHSAARELERVLEEEVQAQESCFDTADHREGVRAFFEHRRPQFGQDPA